MRITARIASHKKRWALDFPKLDKDKCLPWIEGRQVAQPDEIRKALTDPDHFTHSAKDTAYLQCIVAHWIAKLNDWEDNQRVDSNAEGVAESMRRLQRKEELGRFTACRSTFVVHKREVKGEKYLRQEIVFDCERGKEHQVEERDWAYIFAGVMAEAAKVVGEELEDQGYPPIQFTERAQKIYADLIEWRKEDKREKKFKRINERRPICLHHRNGYCSPRLSFCPCYMNGKCVEVK